jgi:hypothetical protein
MSSTNARHLRARNRWRSLGKMKLNLITLLVGCAGLAVGQTRYQAAKDRAQDGSQILKAAEQGPAKRLAVITSGLVTRFGFLEQLE